MALAFVGGLWVQDLDSIFGMVLRSWVPQTLRMPNVTTSRGTEADCGICEQRGLHDSLLVCIQLHFGFTASCGGFVLRLDGVGLSGSGCGVLGLVQVGTTY